MIAALTEGVLFASFILNSLQHYSNPHSPEVHNIIIPGSQMRKLRLKETIHPTYIANKKQSQDENPSLSVRLMLFTAELYFLPM